MKKKDPAKPFYKKVWFWCIVLVALLMLAIAPGTTSDTNPSDSSSDQTAVLEGSANASDVSSETSLGDPSQTSDTTYESADASSESGEPSERTDDTSSEAPQATSDGSEESDPLPESSIDVPGEESQISEAPQEESDPAQAETGKYVGSIESDKYHYPDCRAAKKILSENEIWFASIEDAVAAGYHPCGICNPK